MMKHRIVVVGAGFAGLSAIIRLRKLGIVDVLVVEARGDIGGRVRTTDFSG